MTTLLAEASAITSLVGARQYDRGPVSAWSLGVLMNYRGLSLLAVALALTAAEPGAAAELTPEAMVQGRAPRTVKITARAEAEHDTNVARTTRVLAQRRGLALADTIFTPSLNVDVVMPFGRQAVFLNGEVSYLFHDKNKILDHNRIDLAGGVGNVLGPCGTVLGGAYQRGRSELEDRTLVETVTNVLEVKSANFAITCTRPPGLGVMAAVNRDWGQNSSSQVANSDFETTTYSAGAVYSRPALGTITLQGQYARNEYPKRPTQTGELDGYESLGGGVKFDRRIGGRIQASASLFYTEVKPFLPAPVGSPLFGKDKFHGLTYMAELSFRASSRLQAQVSASREIAPTILQGGGYEVRDDYATRIDYRIGSRFNVGLGAELQDTNLRGGSGTALTILTDSRTRIAFANLRYKQNPRVAFTLTGQLEDRNANNPQFDYSSERVGISADFTF